VARKLGAAVAAATSNPEIQAEIRSQGYEPLVEGPDALAKRIQADNQKWSGVIKAASIALE
jgi:tripartite-type tricarboxylate transporter receptor subunit TctC